MFFFFNDTATTEIYTLSLHDALPIWGAAVPRRTGTCAQGTVVPRTFTPEERGRRDIRPPLPCCKGDEPWGAVEPRPSRPRSEEHTSELQSRQYLVCRLLLEKKKTNTT